MAKAKAQGIPSQHRFDDGTKHGNARRAASPPSAASAPYYSLLRGTEDQPAVNLSCLY